MESGSGEAGGAERSSTFGDTDGATLRRHVSPLGCAVVVALFALLLAILWSASVHAVPGNSDGATVILEGKSISAGNLSLHGWRLSLDSFWGIDAPLYALAVLIVGVRPVLLNLVPAVLAALVVVVGILTAREDRRGAGKIAGAVTVFALLGLPSHAMSVFFLQGPLHVGTALWCLLAFACLRRGRFGRAWIGAVVLLAAGCLGDAQTLVLGVIPVLLTGVAGMLRRRAWRAGIAEVSAAGAAVALALVVRGLALAVGTFSAHGTNVIASPHQRVANLSLGSSYFAKLLGVGSVGFGSGGVPSLLALAHVVGLLAVLGGVVFGLVQLARGTVAPRTTAAGESWRLDDLLVLAFLGDVALFVFLTPAANPSYARYLTDGVIFGSILAGRAMARLADAVPWRSLARVSAGAGIGTVAAFATSFGVNLGQPLPHQPASQLIQFLTAHGLDDGIGDYWSASIVTVESGDQVRVRPAVSTPSGRLESYQKNSRVGWYEDAPFTFLVYNAALPFGNVDTQTARASFGPPSHTYFVDGYFVLVWSHPITVPLAAP